jgi:hypothetical protein
MQVVERSFRLEGSDGLGAKPRPEIIGPVLSSLQHTLQDAVRMGFLHSSHAPGRVPSVLRAAADVRFLGHAADGETATTLRFEVPTFGSAAAELFRQKRLWEDGPQEDETAFELLGSALIDVSDRRAESNRFDKPLLGRIGKYKRTLESGVARIGLPDARVARSVGIDAGLVQTALALHDVTPNPRRVRVTGRLDLMGASQGVLKLDLRPGEQISALWAGVAPIDSLRELFNKDVVLEGVGVFRPSGSLLRVDADAVVSATQQDEFFRKAPFAVAERQYSQLARLKPGDASAYARLRGLIPAEESDDEFIAALESLR